MTHLYEDGAQQGAIDDISDGLLELVLIAAHHESHAGQQLVGFVTLQPRFLPWSTSIIACPSSLQRRRNLGVRPLLSMHIQCFQSDSSFTKFWLFPPFTLDSKLLKF